MALKREGSSSNSSSSFTGWLQRVRRTGEHSDVTVRIQGDEFRLHMLPLVNESAYFRDIASRKVGPASAASTSNSPSTISNSSSSKNTCSTSSSSTQELPGSSGKNRNSNSRLVVQIDDLPGGSEAFSIAADFCYIIRPAYTLRNVGAVRAAAQFLNMPDLVESTKKFLYTNVFSSCKSSVAFLRDFQRVYPPTDEYIESRALRVICAACTKALLETKHVSVPISFTRLVSNATWSIPTSYNLKDVLVSTAYLPCLYQQRLLDMLLDADVNLNIKCRQSRGVRQWLDYLILSECTNRQSRAWVIICLARMLLKNAPKQRPWLELSSQYWCSLLEHAGLLIAEEEDEDEEQEQQQQLEHWSLELLKSVKQQLEYRIGASLHELDDYIQAYNFEPETLLSLVRHFTSAGEVNRAEAEAVAAEVDSSLLGYAETGNGISTDTFVALQEAFPCEMRVSQDVLFAAVERLLETRKVDEETMQRLWRCIDCSMLSPSVYERAMNNASYICQPHVLECVLRKHGRELEAQQGTEMQPRKLAVILQKVINASLRLLEENSKRSQEIVELQNAVASLLSSKQQQQQQLVKVYPASSCDNSPDGFRNKSSSGSSSSVLRLKCCPDVHADTNSSCGTAPQGVQS